MALGAFTLTQLLIIMVIIVLLFGTKKLGGIGEDLGKAVKGFKKAMTDAEAEQQRNIEQHNAPPIEGSAQVKKEEAK